MAFQDFDYLSERRKSERRQKLKKRISIAAGVLFFVLIVATISALMIIHQLKHPDDKHTHQNASKTHQASETPSIEPKKPNKDVSHLKSGVKMVCAATDYKQTCESVLTKKLSSYSSTSTNPKDLLKASFSVILDEIDEGFNQTIQLKIDDPKVTSAIEDCRELLNDAKEELGFSISHVSDGKTNQIPSKAHDLNNWLSAVMSYQQTCIDGFPEGELKSKTEEGLKTAKELTSNALAIISEFSSILSALKIPGLIQRKLLSNELPNGSDLNVIDEDGVPSWMTHEDRRILKAQSVTKLKPNVVVAKDGSGDFKTISEALAKMPPEFDGRYIIYVKEGVYDETVIIEKKMVNITMYGDGSQKTIVTGSKNFVDGVGTYKTASFAAIGEGFIAKAMGFRNTAGPEKHQAVALRVQSDRSVFINCRMEGYQDTLYVQTHRQFYRSCVIAGTVDFIFGDAAVIFQNCLIVVRKPLENQQNIVTAQGRIDKHETTGIVIQNCRIQPDKKLIPEKSKIRSYLGRPWKEYSRTIIMESTIDDLIHADGWLPWDGDFALKTLYYAEYNNKGPGARVTDRVKWAGYKKSISKDEAAKYTVEPFLQGSNWIKASGTPVRIGLFN